MLAAATADDFQQIWNALKQESAKFYADLVYNVHTSTFDDEFLQLAPQVQIQWSEYLKAPADRDPTALQKTYGTYLTSLTSQPVAIGDLGANGTAMVTAPVDVSGATYSDAAQEERMQLYKIVCEKRRQQAEFLGPAPLDGRRCVQAGGSHAGSL